MLTLSIFCFIQLAEWYSKEKKDIEFLIYDFTKLEKILKENDQKLSKTF